MSTETSVTNVLTFDLEHWYTATLVRDAVADPVDRIETSVERVLDLLADHDTSATFFVVGEVAEEYPDLVARVSREGHELATHGHTHTPLFDLDRDSFARELDRSISAIERAADVTVKGFRAPNFSVAPETAWALDVLAEKGFAYDSSVFPVRTPMYGVTGAPTGPYRIDQADPFVDHKRSDGMFEVPLAVHPRTKIPVAGGFYARLLPTRIIKWGIEALNARGRPAVLYFHPWECNPEVRSDEPPAHARFISYYGIERTENVLGRLCGQYAFDSVSEILDTL